MKHVQSVSFYPYLVGHSLSCFLSADPRPPQNGLSSIAFAPSWKSRSAWNARRNSVRWNEQNSSQIMLPDRSDFLRLNKDVFERFNFAITDRHVNS
jgi:hypothetical protein